MPCKKGGAHPQFKPSSRWRNKLKSQWERKEKGGGRIRLTPRNDKLSLLSDLDSYDDDMIFSVLYKSHGDMQVVGNHKGEEGRKCKNQKGRVVPRVLSHGPRSEVAVG